MTSSPNSPSDQASQGFEKLDPCIQRWIWASGWTELRDAQERAIPLILSGETDVIIAASTASGKTEAAFFPILTTLRRVSKPGERQGIAMYVGPLKALINDQWQRLAGLVESMDIPVTPWHGDISGSLKTRFLKDPSGCLLITPESLEAILMRHGSGAAGIFAGLRYIVIDELHSFMGSERGKQLQSQIHRIESVLGRRVCRVGLSATLGDMEAAKAFLRPENPAGVSLIVAKDGSQELHVLIKGFVEDPHNGTRAQVDLQNRVECDEPAQTAIVSDLYRVLRGSNNLVFPNSRSKVEFLADRLRRRCEAENVPNEFYPHHGSLAKEIREETEAALKGKERPATAICTNTLELGIDIGAVRSVVQIGPPPSVASLRQRLGRSGRRKGEAAILRGFVIESQLSDSSDLSDQLRQELVQSVAMVRLLAGGWYEPVKTSGLHASTLVQQILSVITQYGGMRARQIWDLLCQNGAFSAVEQGQFLALLKQLGQKEIIFQDATGLILLAPDGEKITEHYNFYAAFATEEEFRIVNGGNTIGSMPISQPLIPGGYLIFGGRRWQVVSISQKDLVIDVRTATAGTIPSFDGTGAIVHGRVREEMRAVLRSDYPVPFLDKTGQQLLLEARHHYGRLSLDSVWVRQSGADTQIFLWTGDVIQNTLIMMLQGRGFKGINEGVSIKVLKSNQVDVVACLDDFARSGPVSGVELAADVPIKIVQKWDALLPQCLLDSSFASEHFDTDGVIKVLSAILLP